MSIEEQVAVIFCGVRGHLDKVEPAKITTFEEGFLQYIRSNYQATLDSIRDESQISPDSEAKLKEAVSTFLETFQ